MTIETNTAPHYSVAVNLLNQVGGLFLGHFRHGAPHDGTVVPGEIYDRIPHGGVVFVEGLPTDQLPLRIGGVALGIQQASADRGTIVLPGDHSAPDLARLLADESNLSDIEYLREYERLQKMREMQAVMGSLAWLLAFTENREDITVIPRPVAFWGRHHSSSLADMYE